MDAFTSRVTRPLYTQAHTRTHVHTRRYTEWVHRCNTHLPRENPRPNCDPRPRLPGATRLGPPDKTREKRVKRSTAFTDTEGPTFSYVTCTCTTPRCRTVVCNPYKITVRQTHRDNQNVSRFTIQGDPEDRINSTH